MAGQDEVKTVDELAVMSEGERVQYFLDHPVEGVDPEVDPPFVARSSARLVPIVVRRDAEQAAKGDAHAS